MHAVPRRATGSSSRKVRTPSKWLCEPRVRPKFGCIITQNLGYGTLSRSEDVTNLYTNKVFTDISII